MTRPSIITGRVIFGLAAAQFVFAIVTGLLLVAAIDVATMGLIVLTDHIVARGRPKC